MSQEQIAAIGARFDAEMAAHAHAARRRVAEALDLTVEQVAAALAQRDQERDVK